MPYLDVTSLLADPDIAGEPFIVVRRQQFVNSNGVVSTGATAYNAFGSIGPVSAAFLQRLEDQQFVGKAISVVTTFMLRNATKEIQGYSYQPDLIQWKNNYYLVNDVADFSQFGAGMVQANCTTFDYIDVAPDGSTAAPVGVDFSGPWSSDQISPIQRSD